MKRILSLAAAAILALGVSAPVLAAEAGVTTSTGSTVTSGSVYSYDQHNSQYNGVEVDQNFSGQLTLTATNDGLLKSGGAFGLIGTGNGSLSGSLNLSTAGATTWYSGNASGYQTFNGYQNTTTFTSTSSAFSNF
jgi:hypothetical protein